MPYNPNEPFQLPLLPPRGGLETIQILKALVGASREIGVLKGRCNNIPNPMLLMSLAITKESVESSGIEDIVTTVESVLEGQGLPESEIKAPDKEVLRYREAMNWGMDNLDKYSISTRLIQGIHKKLIPSSTGYRKQQNAIKDQRVGKVVYTPPPATEIDRLLQNWENFVNEEDSDSPLDPLIRCALAHYQFEAIHPFMDGNGRTGRILLVLQLVKERVINYPVLYVSGFLKKFRSAYYRKLLDVTRNGNWEGFLTFMLTGFENQSLKTTLKLFEMMTVYEKLKKEINENHRKINAEEFTNHIFYHLITNPERYRREVGITHQTASRHLVELRNAQLLKDFWMGKNHFYFHPELLKLTAK
jgi:Fic family protein